MTNRRRVAAFLLCIGFVFALAVSSAFIAHEAGHNCSGHGCPICQMIAANVNLLRTLGLAVLILLALFAMLQGRFAHRNQQRLCLSASDTLVSWKIRLND
ncbi:MAG: hypothetical protein K6A68_15465 [Clostridiales bacterium]|nr:hypothetical protein [Clostridiales bacterium]